MEWIDGNRRLLLAETMAPSIVFLMFHKCFAHSSNIDMRARACVNVCFWRSRWFPPGDLPLVNSPGNFNRWFPPDLESLLQRMKRLVFAKPVTRRLTPGSDDYTNPNTNPTRPSRHVIWTGGDHPGELPGEITGPGGVYLLRTSLWWGCDDSQ